METTKDTNLAPAIKMKLARPNNGWTQALYTRNANPNGNTSDEFIEPLEFQTAKGRVHACQASQRFLQQAGDRLGRANRDLGETAAFVAASLTTVTAVEAVINIAIDKVGISHEILQVAFKVFAVLLVWIIMWGAIRARDAIQRRTQAEKDIDQAKKGIFEFCPVDQWPKLEG